MSIGKFKVNLVKIQDEPDYFLQISCINGWKIQFRFTK